MAKFERQLAWREDPERFDEAEQLILIALSNKKWLWRTMGSIARATRLSTDELSAGLQRLMEDELVKGSISRRTRQPIFGLIERVATGRR